MLPRRPIAGRFVVNLVWKSLEKGHTSVFSSFGTDRMYCL